VYTTDEDNTYSWYTWLLTNNVTPEGNPTAYTISTREFIQRLVELYEYLWGIKNN